MFPREPHSKSTSGAQQDLGLNEHPYWNLSYAPDQLIGYAGRPNEWSSFHKCIVSFILHHNNRAIKYMFFLHISYIKREKKV